LEKKAIPTGMIIFAPSGADPQLSCDLISALTDADMEIIENYASRLEEALGGDAEDAYAIAMDAFVRGEITLICTANCKQHHCALLYNTIRCSTVQYSTVQYSTVQYSTVQYSTVQYSKHGTVHKHCTASYCLTQHFTFKRHAIYFYFILRRSSYLYI
jgi:hypothetical protein